MITIWANKKQVLSPHNLIKSCRSKDIARKLKRCATTKMSRSSWQHKRNEIFILILRNEFESSALPCPSVFPGSSLKNLKSRRAVRTLCACERPHVGLIINQMRGRMMAICGCFRSKYASRAHEKFRSREKWTIQIWGRIVLLWARWQGSRKFIVHS